MHHSKFQIPNSKFWIAAIFIILAGIAFLRFEGFWWPLHYSYILPRTNPPLEFMSPEVRFEKSRTGLKLLGEPIYFNFSLPSWYDQATVVLTIAGQTASPIYVGAYKSDGSATLALWRTGFSGQETEGITIPLDGLKREQGLQQIFIGAPNLKSTDEIVVKKAEFYFKSKSHRVWLRKIFPWL
ncbi:MAG: hypothetical protein UV05_C0006G0012 [candidate division CPR1 bacterium GW2011_GWA2_42_17]|uniref:Uncharacterized protein n=1 Tax=candidate division CPR1 bacterium GW2011_GWA2_42_17 TaxID=1618341 RepID=A0A0G1C473_9BACT|nr:MAG: hypothetical protein UV05_C0006G0012 [candidate division CPR1 bacterium GW2011_GWA2_42_17]